MASSTTHGSALTKVPDGVPGLAGKDDPYDDLRGYLKKKSKQDKWQKRWFEANDHYLTYYKTPQSKKLLACIDLYQTGEIKLVLPDSAPGADVSTEFSISLGDRFYIIKAEGRDDAQRWVEGLRKRQVPPVVEAPSVPDINVVKGSGAREGRFTSFADGGDRKKAGRSVDNPIAGGQLSGSAMSLEKELDGKQSEDPQAAGVCGACTACVVM